MASFPTSPFATGPTHPAHAASSKSSSISVRLKEKRTKKLPVIIPMKNMRSVFLVGRQLALEEPFPEFVPTSSGSSFPLSLLMMEAASPSLPSSPLPPPDPALHQGTWRWGQVSMLIVEWGARRAIPRCRAEKVGPFLRFVALLLSSGVVVVRVVSGVQHSLTGTCLYTKKNSV